MYESRGLLRAGDAVTPDAASIERVREIRRLVQAGYSLERIAAEITRDATGVRRPTMPDARAFAERIHAASVDLGLACIEEQYGSATVRSRRLPREFAP